MGVVPREANGTEEASKQRFGNFHGDLKQLVECTNPDLQKDTTGQLTLTHYLGQLKHQQLAFSVKLKYFKTMDEADATLEMESYLLPKGSQVPQVAEGYIPIESPQSAESSLVVSLPAPPQADQ